MVYKEKCVRLRKIAFGTHLRHIQTAFKLARTLEKYIDC